MKQPPSNKNKKIPQKQAQENIKDDHINSSEASSAFRDEFEIVDIKVNIKKTKMHNNYPSSKIILKKRKQLDLNKSPLAEGEPKPPQTISNPYIYNPLDPNSLPTSIPMEIRASMDPRKLELIEGKPYFINDQLIPKKVSSKAIKEGKKIAYEQKNTTGHSVNDKSNKTYHNTHSSNYSQFNIQYDMKSDAELTDIAIKELDEKVFFDILHDAKNPLPTVHTVNKKDTLNYPKATFKRQKKIGSFYHNEKIFYDRVFPGFDKLTGADILYCRELLGWSQLRIANTIGVNFFTYATWEQHKKGKINMRHSSRLMFSEFFNYHFRLS
ncbi:MAG: hypothetical protein LBE38_10660 [Deltaproteobacteria bacterium]|jgi:DNA-binding transcriptional regulator YiaG|nr:hypothetical protein [Deltaproteobacteria bacterium]